MTFPRLHPTALAYMRRALQASLTDRCVIERLTVTRGPYGEATETWTTVAQVPCRVIMAGQSNAGLRVEAGGQQDFVREVWRLVLPWNITVSVGYRVRVSGTGESEREYRVIGVQDNLTDAVDTQVLIERWQSDTDQRA